MAIRKYPKGSTQHVQLNFQALDFDCKKCSNPTCTETWIDDDLALNLQRLYNAILLPVHITEGFRCKAKQEALRAATNPDGTPKYLTAVGTSTHETGMAADIRTNKHTGAELEAFARKVGFKAVGVGSKFVHIDTRDILASPGKTRRWTYPY